MLVRNLGLLASVALTARAWRSPVVVVEQPSPTLEVDCRTCIDFVMLGPDRTMPKVQLNFTFGHHHPHPLLLNDVQIYPPVTPSPAEPLMARVERGPRMPEESVRLGYEMEIARSNWIYPPNVEDISLTFTVVQVAGKLTTDFDAVELKMVKHSDHRPARITALAIKPTADPNASPSEQEKAGEAKECSRLPLLCKWKAILSAKLAQAKNKLHGHKCHHHHKLPDVNAQAGPDGRVNFKAHGHHRHHHHHHHHHRHSFLKSVVLHVILPIFVGMAAGMTASLLGMVIGQLIVRLWQRFYRGDKKGAYVLVDGQDEFPCDEKVPVEFEYRDEKAEICLAEVEEVIAASAEEGSK